MDHRTRTERHSVSLESQKQKTVKVGWVQRAHGIRGEIYIRLYNPQPDWLDKLKNFTLTAPLGGSLEYPVGRARPHKEGLIISCPDIPDRCQAESLKGYSVEIPRNYLVANKSEGEMYLSEILSFEVVVKGYGIIGKVEGFTGHKAQDMLIVKGPKYTYEIPFVDEYLIKTCFKDSQLYMELPEGLLELYEL